ncbi:MAG: glycerol kinase GlpK [Lachnospiraceae bacterium]|nr:glycerol kinase GlpK [Lachnospiraceae bacterium]
MGQYLMALDQGTTSSRCIIFDRNGNIASSAQKEFEQYYPKPGWVEHNPKEIWSSQLSVAAEAMALIGAKADDIAAIGITNQRETTIVWDKNTGEPVFNAIVWQCRRTAPIIDEIIKNGCSDLIRSRTGLVPDAYFSASKIKWILDNVPGARKKAGDGELLFGTVDTWLIWKLTKGRVHATDYTNASRTMLFDIHRLEWDPELLQLFDIPEAMLPKVHPSGYVYGYTDEGILGGGIPIAGAAGDQQAALFGQCCFEKGDVKNTYGTGSFILMNTGKDVIRSDHGLVTTIAAGCDGNPDYALEGSVFVAGAAIQWLRDAMKLIDTAARSGEYAGMVEDPNGVYVVPAFTGLGAPWWDQYAQGSVFGITRGCTREHFIRATLESIAYQSNDVFRAMEEDAKVKIRELKVDGGASANDLLMKFQADISDTVTDRPQCIETTAMGAAYLAGLSTGFYSDRDEIRSNRPEGRKFLPDMDAHRREELLKGWNRAVRAALYWSSSRE